MFSTTVRARTFLTAGAALLAVCCMTAAPQAQGARAAFFRIFLSDGTSLVSYGEFARVADRVVFSVPLGEGPDPKLQLVSIPESTVNWARTDEYAVAVRAHRYADTRGEQDFVMLTGQVTAALNDIALAPDPKRRVAMAEEARRNLAAWPAANHGYRAADVAQLVGILDDVVAEMRIAAGEKQFDLSLVATSTPPPLAPLLPPPDVRSSLETAYRAALLASEPDERLALLRTLTHELRFAPSTATWAPVLRAQASAALQAELRVEDAYGDLVKNALKGAGERAARADVRGLQQIIARALSTDDRLGRRRSGQMAGLLAALDLRLDEARRLRLARDGWGARVEAFKDYRAAIRTPRERVARLRKWLVNIRDLSGPDPTVLRKLDEYASVAQREFSAVTPPPELQAAHGLFVASVHMIRQAASLRRNAIASNNLRLAWDASSAAAGALMLAERASDDVNRLVSGPPHVPVITPRLTRLVRVPDLKAMQAAIAQLACGGGPPAVRRCAVIVPTRGAAEELRRTLENTLLATSQAMIFPDLLTRTDLYERLHAASAGLPPVLSPQEREVLLRRAARTAAAAAPPPFSLRPGLILELLRFYDELRRREQSLDDFSRLVTSQLAPNVETDRGAERLLRQTEFLAAAYAQFERLTRETGAIDEHGLRTLLLDSTAPAQAAYTHVVVTVGDQAADPRGLYASDFDLLARVGGVGRLDVVATERLLASGFHERVHDLLPGVEEERFDGRCGTSSTAPTLAAPASDEHDRRWFTCRDREEELADFVRDLKHRAVSADEARRPPALERCAIVFQRPLPYLYLARQVFADGGVAYQSVDALPLSAEPFPAAIDLVLSFLTADGNRASTIALLSSPHFRFAADAGAIAALERRLRELKFSGGWDRLASIAAIEPAAAALSAAVSAASELSPVRLADSAAAQLDALLAFVRRFEALPRADAPWRERHLRARAAVLAAIESLRDAHARHDNEPLELNEFAGSLRRWIEAQTFAPLTGTGGVRLVDAAAAAYADVVELRIVGLVESDWPEPAAHSIFYPSGMLSQLGWPVDAARASAARARFCDLISLPKERLSASAFTLEEDSIVAPSPFVEELEAAGLPIERAPCSPPAFVFMHEALAAEFPVPFSAPTDGSTPAAQWLTLRASRTPSTDERYRGTVGSLASKTYAISYVERYLECPFKYYASQVLRLPEERDEEPGLTPQERGHFIHEVFEQFFKDWQQAGRRTITTGNVADAILIFEMVVESRLEDLPEADRALERTHLLGSAAAAGLAERAFAFEIEQGGEVVERLLEHALEDTFEFEGPDGARRPIAVRAKADRIDLMADGTLRVIDYKLGRAPKLARALQLPIYGVCAEQALEGHRGRSWKLERAGYVAFKEKDPFVPLAGRSPLSGALKDGQARFLEAIDAIERGEFPVRPDEPFRCQWCGYAGVCRKDYVGDE